MKVNEKEVRKIADVLNDINIIDNEKLHSVVDFVFSHMAKSIGRTLGPGGGYTIVSNIDATVPVYPTKDGFTVANEMKFNDQMKFFITKMITDISLRMNNEVGDSTTSGIIIGYDLYSKLMKYDITTSHPSIGCALPPISIRNILEEIRTTLTRHLLANPSYILKNDIPRERENLLVGKVATISANNDREIGKIVSDLFTKRETNHVYVTVEVGTDDETIVDKEVGFEFGSGFVNPIMANMPDRITCKFDNPRFLLCDGPLTTNDLANLDKMIDYVIYELKQPLVIVAKDYDQIVTNAITARCTRNIVERNGQQLLHEKEKIACLMIDSAHEKSKDRLEDLRIILGCEIVTTKKGKIFEFKNNVDFLEKFLGSAVEFKGTQLSTRIKRGKGDQTAIRERIVHIENRIKETMNNDGILSFVSVEGHKRRIAMLNSDMNIIKVGGANDKERRAKKLVYDDAVMACNSAINHGFTLGGNVSVTNYIKNNFGTLVCEISDNIVNSGIHVVVGNDIENVKLVVRDILDFVYSAFCSAYSVAIGNMVGVGTPVYESIVKEIFTDSHETPVILDLVTNKKSSFDTDEVPSPVVPGNTDLELMSAIFGTVGILVSSNQFLTIYPGDSVVYRVDR